MMLFALAALVHGSVLFRMAMLERAIEEMNKPENKAVNATVDGKPIHSYVLDVSMDGNE